MNGETVLWPQRRIDPRRDRVEVDGRAVDDHAERVVLALHKPEGFITSRTDPAGRETVYDLLGDFGRWVFPVGRLDRDSSGLLLLTNDHRLGHSLTDPERHVPKTYHVLVHGVPDGEALRALREGVRLADGVQTRPAVVRSLGSARGRTWLEVVLVEGRNRQVRRMCATVGHRVERLVRVAVGGIALGDLPPGAWRQLSDPEVSALRRTPRDAGAGTPR